MTRDKRDLKREYERQLAIEREYQLQDELDEDENFEDYEYDLMDYDHF